jgi:hypothetical protein
MRMRGCQFVFRNTIQPDEVGRRTPEGHIGIAGITALQWVLPLLYIAVNSTGEARSVPERRILAHAVRSRFSTPSNTAWPSRGPCPSGYGASQPAGAPSGPARAPGCLASAGIRRDCRRFIPERASPSAWLRFSSTPIAGRRQAPRDSLKPSFPTMFPSRRSIPLRALTGTIRTICRSRRLSGGTGLKGEGRLCSSFLPSSRPDANVVVNPDHPDAARIWVGPEMPVALRSASLRTLTRETTEMTVGDPPPFLNAPGERPPHFCRLPPPPRDGILYGTRDTVLSPST